MNLSGGTSVAVAVAVILTACTVPSDGDATPQPSASPLRSEATDGSEPMTDTAPERCATPTRAVVARAKAAIAPHPGPVRAATLVRAATTGTGTWYVVALDRAYVLDDGSPTGDASRSLALTDSTSAGTGARMIPLGQGEATGDVPISWDRVSWTGETLRAGQRAADRAIECLEAQVD